MMHTTLTTLLSQGVIILLQVEPGLDLAGGSESSGPGFLSIFLTVVLVALGGAALFFGYKWYQDNIATGASRSPSHAVMSKETRRRINKAMDDGQFEAAGDMFLRAGLPGDAGEAFLRANAYLKAASAFHQSGNLPQAIFCYKKAGSYQQAAKLYAEDGEHRAAAAEYVQAKEWRSAADQYAKAEDFKRAAEYYERSDVFLRAGELFEQVNDPMRAAENFARHLEQRSRGAESVTEDEDRDLAKRIGALFKDAGDMDRASSMFRLGGHFQEAADCLRTSGDYSRAAEMLIAANKPMMAAKVLEEAGEEQEASKMRAEAALESGDLEVAADQLAKAGQLERAAEIYEELGKLARAAEIHEKLKHHERAADLYVRSGKFANAARSAEALGQTARAADLYEQAGDIEGQLRMLIVQGDNFKAGQMLFELRRFDEALIALERLDSTEPLYIKALELQGDVLRAQGRAEKAYSRYRAALGTQSADATTIALYYKMGRTLEELDDPAGAAQNYDIVTQIDSHFEDTEIRLKGLRDRQRRKRVTTSGLFSTDAISGTQESRFEVIDEIARGGMGIVYRARDTVLGRVVAFKVLGENLRENETAVKYFEREARAAAAFQHPNIVTIYDFGEQDAEIFMAMEYVEGTTLKELIRRNGALTEGQVRFILVNTCKALQYAHGKEVIHRDIKSGNVMITRDQTLKVMDFGLAKFLREYQNNHTQQVGTPFYMSPEQVVGKNVDFRSDLYSTGCMAFECATGTVPFFKGDLSYHHMHTPPPKPRSINPVISKELEGVILKLLEKDPDDRYQSAGEIIQLLS